MPSWLGDVAFVCLIAGMTAPASPAQSLQDFQSSPTSASPRQYQLDLSLRAGDPKGNPEKGTIKVLSQPSLAVLGERPCAYSAGGKLPTGFEMIPVGIRVDAIVAAAPGEPGKVRLQLQLHCNKVLERGEDGGRIELIYFHCNRVLNLGEVVTLRGDKMAREKTWVEVMVREIEE